MNHLYLSWRDVENYTQEILRQLQSDGWKPDYIVGITRGGLMPANLISQYLGVTMHTLDVSFREGSDGPESNLWMSEDAFGYDSHPKQILIVDDINDSGRTLNWIKQDWQASCQPKHAHWAEVWATNVRVAVLIDNESSQCELPITYKGRTINKQKDPCWVVYPWEEWWLK